MAAFSPADAAAMAGDTVSPAIFLLVFSTAGPLRMWSGFGDFALPADAIDVDGGVYSGLGQLAGAPAVNELINGVAQRINFTLSGVSAEILALVDADAASIRNAPVFLGFTNLGDDGRPRFDPIWLWEGEADTPSITRPPGAGPRAVSLSVGSEMTGRKRAEFAFYTGPEQRRRFPTDAGLDRVGEYDARSTVRWPT